MVLTGAAHPTSESRFSWETALDRVAIFFVTSVPVISLVAVALLVCGSFTAQRALVIGIPIALWLMRALLRASGPDLRWPKRGVAWLALVLLLAFLMRLPPALYLQSVGDPGVYMAMSGHFAQKGSLDVTDDVRDRLVSPEAVARFDSNNAYYVYQPGIFIDVDSPGHYVFQFYHVHPAWLAIFGGLLGLEHAGGSQIFFGLLSLFFAALIVERLCGDWKFGVATAGILALLPLHVFFSKFPISEMPTMTFAFIAIYAIVRAAESQIDFPEPRWLVLAALAFAALFLTRISGFVYLPVIYLGAVLCQVFIDADRARRRWGVFWFSLAALYFGSVVYGLVWSGPYSVSIYHMHFGFHMLRWLPWVLLALVVTAAIPFLVLCSTSFRMRARAMLLDVWTIAQRWLPLLVLGLVLAGAARVYLLAFTDYYQGNTWYDETWGMSHAGFEAILRSALLVAAENLGPALILLLAFSLWRPGNSPPSVLLAFMVVVMIGYSAVLQWFLPYQYYYARYLLSELIPFSILLMALRCAEAWNTPALRRWILGASIFTIAYFAWFTWPLIGFNEALGAETSLARIANELDRRSVLLVDEGSVRDPSRFVTPLRAWYGKSVYIVRDLNQITDILRDLRRAGIDDVKLLAGNANIPPPFAFEKKLRFEQKTMERSALIPRDTETYTADFTLSRLDDERLSSLELTSRKGLHVDDMARGCCSGFVPRDIWTDAHASIRGLALPSGAWTRLIITMRGIRPDYTGAGLVVHVNGRELPAGKVDGRILEFQLGSMAGPTRFDLDLDTNTFVPRELGLNDDPRSLGVDIESLRVE